MTEAEIKTLLASTGIRTYRGHAPVGTKVPYLVFNISYGENFGADDIVYQKIPTVEAQLYNTRPDPETSGEVEQALTDAGIYWTGDTADSPDESLFINIYYFGGIQNG